MIVVEIHADIEIYTYTSHYENVPFEVPEGWCWGNLINICNIFGRIGFRGYTKEDLVKHDGAITLSPSNIIEGKMNYNSCTYISWNKYDESPEIQIQENDILLVKTGSSYGKCALVEKLPKQATINPQFVVLKHISCNPEYLTYVLQSKYAQNNYEKFVLGTAIPTFTQVALGNMQIPIPPLTEQNRIVKEIKRLLGIIESLESNKKHLKEIVTLSKSKILEIALSGKLISQNTYDEPAIELLKRINPSYQPCDNRHYRQLPDSWETCQLKDIFDITMGQSPAGDTINGKYGTEFHQGKINFTNKYLAESAQYTTTPSKIAAPESLLLCVRAPVGIVNITKREICIGRGLCSLRPKYDIDSLYWLYMLSTLKDYFEENATGSTFKAISGDIIRNASIPFPPLSEQRRILSKINELFCLLDKITAEL